MDSLLPSEAGTKGGGASMPPDELPLDDPGGCWIKLKGVGVLMHMGP